MAKERSYDYFWNSDSDRYYDAESMGDWLRPFFKNGVFNGQMQVTENNDMSVTVAAGYGYINGKLRHFLTPTTLDLEVASGTLDRIDSVILRKNDTERRIHLMIKKGGNAKAPVAPVPTRKGAIYDLKLADIYIAAGTVKVTQAEITDTRMDSAVCGWVCGAVEQIEFEQIKAQFDAFFAKYKSDITNEYTVYTGNITVLEQQAQERYNSMDNELTEYENQQKEDFEEWLATIKTKLNEADAARLQNEIDVLTGNTLKKSDMIASLAINVPGKVMDGKTCAEGINKAMGTVLTATLAAGTTTLILTSSSITDDSLIDVYTDKADASLSAMVQSNHTLTLTFDAQTQAVNVKVRVV